MRPGQVFPQICSLVVSAVCLASAGVQEPGTPAGKGTVLAQDSKSDSKSEGKPPEAKPPEPSKPEPGKVVSSPILTIKLAFMADPRLFPYDINVEMNGEAMILTGKVPHDTLKVAAGETAKGLAKSVTNNIEVDKDIDREVARKRDEAITHYVKDRFTKSKTLEKADFGVKTEEGVVSLSGKTRFQVIVLEAAEAVRNVPGVKAVKTDSVRLEAD